MISFGILGHCGVLETTRTVAVSVATGVGCQFVFDGFEPIPDKRLLWVGRNAASSSEEGEA